MSNEQRRVKLQQYRRQLTETLRGVVKRVQQCELELALTFTSLASLSEDEYNQSAGRRLCGYVLPDSNERVYLSQGYMARTSESTDREFQDPFRAAYMIARKALPEVVAPPLNADETQVFQLHLTFPSPYNYRNLLWTSVADRALQQAVEHNRGHEEQDDDSAVHWDKVALVVRHVIALQHPLVTDDGECEKVTGHNPRDELRFHHNSLGSFTGLCCRMRWETAIRSGTEVAPKGRPRHRTAQFKRIVTRRGKTFSVSDWNDPDGLRWTTGCNKRIVAWLKEHPDLAFTQRWLHELSDHLLATEHVSKSPWAIAGRFQRHLNPLHVSHTEESAASLAEVLNLVQSAMTTDTDEPTDVNTMCRMIHRRCKGYSYGTCRFPFRALGAPLRSPCSHSLSQAV